MNLFQSFPARDLNFRTCFRSELTEKTNSSSVPKVWVKGNFIGGCNDGADPQGEGVEDIYIYVMLPNSSVLSWKIPSCLLYIMLPTLLIPPSNN